MKFSTSLVCIALLLAGCPDPKLPKVPPSAPEPKADISKQRHAAVVPHQHHAVQVYRVRMA